jgi:hypothetical protein
MQSGTCVVKIGFVPFENAAPLNEDEVRARVPLFVDAVKLYGAKRDVTYAVRAHGASSCLMADVEFIAVDQTQADRLSSALQSDLMNALDDAGLYQYFRLVRFDKSVTS